MKKLFMFFIILHPVLLISQNEYNQLHFKHISVENGLSQSWVQCIVQDNLGFMWFGTADGLNQYDGYHFKIFKHNPKSRNSIKNNNITKICLDQKNNLWIGTSTGICLFNRADENFFFAPEWPEIYVTDILPKDNYLIIGSDQGLFLLNTESMNFQRLVINLHEILTEPYISCIEKDKNEFLWIGTLNGLYTTNDRLLDIRKIPLDTINKKTLRISCVHADTENIIWVGTETSGLFRLEKDPGSSNFVLKYHYKPGIDNNTISDGSIRTIEEDIHNNLWLGIENAGINIIQNINRRKPLITKILHEEKNNNGLTSNSIYDIYKDEDSDIWLGTYGGGIGFYNHLGINFIHYKHSPENSNSLINNNVNVFFEYNNKIIIGTEGGLSIFNPKEQSFENYLNTSEIPDNRKSDAIWAIAKDKNNQLWIGTWANGVSIFDPIKKSSREIFSENLYKSNIFSILEDSKGLIWIATMGEGLLSYQKQTGKLTIFQTNVKKRYSISNNWVRQIYENSRGELWISTGSSLDLYNRDQNEFYHFCSNIYDTTTISGRGSYIIFEDSKENMWFGTDAGLNYFVREDSTFKYYQEDDGLPNNSVKAILEDDHGNLWLSTNRGISKLVNGINLPEKPEFQNFDVSDGLQGNEFNRRAALYTQDGLIYFGGNQGFNIFNPDSLCVNRKPPVIVFTNFMISNKVVNLYDNNSPLKTHISLADKITLKYSQSVFTIEFAALNYINSDKNRYAYMLEGFDKSWNEVGNQRTANYTNINPGKYLFKVKASNNDGFWNQKGAQIAITILPPWYRTKIAYLIYFLILGALVITFRRMILIRAKLQHEIELQRLEKEKLDEMHQVKTRFFTNISHEFRTPLTLIIAPIERIIQNYGDHPEINSQFQVILKNAKRMLRLINQFMDLSKIEAGYLKLAVHEGNIAKYIQTISDIFLYQARQKNINFVFEGNHTSFVAWFDGDKIEKILYNLLSNAIKFTPENKQITLRVKYYNTEDKNISNAGYMEIWVIDTGIGMKENDKEKIFTRFFQAENSTAAKYSGTGIGLSLVYGLVVKYGGIMEFYSVYGQGSTFYVKLPIARNMFPEESIINKTEEEYLSNLEVYNYSGTISQIDKISTISENNDLEKPKLLIVEDNADLIDYMYQHFHLKYHVLNALNGTDGIAIARKHFPDIIISDIMMAGTDGIELCKKLKTTKKTSHIPIILLTAKVSNQCQVESFQTGADAFLTKPFNIDVLEARITNLLQSRKKLKDLFIQKVNLEPRDITITSIDAKFLKKAMELVEINISNADFSTDKMSHDMNMSRASLHRKMVALTGIPPSSFIRTLRMKRAARLLVEGQKTVSEVLYEVGIKSRSYFTKSFKETYGMSPTEYVSTKKSQQNVPEEITP